MMQQKDAWKYFIEILCKNNIFEEVINEYSNALERNNKFKGVWYHMVIGQYKLSKFE